MSNKRASSFKACCSNFNKFKLVYGDLATPDDEILYLLVGLLGRVSDSMPLDRLETQSLAGKLEEYLNRKLVLEHYLFGRSLRLCTLCPTDLQLEVKRIEIKSKKLFRGK